MAQEAGRDELTGGHLILTRCMTIHAGQQQRHGFSTGLREITYKGSGREATTDSTMAWPEILRGWSAYFSYGALASAYEAIDQHVYDRARNFLRQRHKAQGRGVGQFSREHVYGALAVRCLRRERGRSSPWALR